MEFYASAGELLTHFFNLRMNAVEQDNKFAFEKLGKANEQLLLVADESIMKCKLSILRNARQGNIKLEKLLR